MADEANAYAKARLAKQNTLRRLLDRDPVFAHKWLCHGDGTTCTDGCEKTADPERAKFYYSDKD